jgi:ketopantoate reductase
MLQDMSRGDATEIDYINGYIVRLGKLAAVPTPINETMVDMIKLKHRINTSKWPSNRPREGTG